VVRLARSKQLTALAVLEVHGGLERSLKPLGFKVQWLDFPLFGQNGGGEKRLKFARLSGLRGQREPRSPMREL